MSEGVHPANCARPDPEDSDLIAFLSQPGSYGDRPSRVEIIETHAARVFLAGSKAFKIKKRVKLPFLDFSTLAKRQHALQRELELNQVQAPEIYRRLVPIARNESGFLTFGDGIVVDYALEMNRFDQSNLLAEIASRRPLPSKITKDLAAMAARYHRSSRILTETPGAEAMRGTVLALAAELTDAAPRALQPRAQEFRTRSLEELKRLSSLLDRRAEQGHVRRCHGDLHLGNIVMISDHAVPFDALEFNEGLASIDVLYDLAFLIMDLHTRGDGNAANGVLNAYVGAEPTGHEIEGLAALPLFLATRAAVRAVVAIERAKQRPSGDDDIARAHRYLDAANGYLTPPKPVLIAIGGHSGTGKSTLAAALAPSIGPAPGALHLRSDVERKKLFGVAEDERLPPSSYTEATSDQVYAILYEKTQRTLAAGHAAIVDGVSAKPEERSKIAAIADNAGCAFAGLWLEAPLTAKIARIEARRGDASDADSRVVRAQANTDDGEITWSRIDAGRSAGETLAEAKAVLAHSGPFPS